MHIQYMVGQGRAWLSSAGLPDEGTQWRWVRTVSPAEGRYLYLVWPYCTADTGAERQPFTPATVRRLAGAQATEWILSGMGRRLRSGELKWLATWPVRQVTPHPRSILRAQDRARVQPWRPQRRDARTSTPGHKVTS